MVNSLLYHTRRAIAVDLNAAWLLAYSVSN